MSGHLFQGHYKSFLVQEGDYLLGLSRYVHLNPVRGVSLGRGTPNERRKRLRAFGWSSYPGYAGLRAQYPFIEEEMVLGELDGPRRGERLRYRRFVEEGLVREMENPFEAVRWQAVLGNETLCKSCAIGERDYTDVMTTSITIGVAAMVVGISGIALAGDSHAGGNTDYIAAIERYDAEAWASYDLVDRHEVTTGADRGAQVYAYRQDRGNVQRIVFDYGLSQTDALYCLLYKEGKLVKATKSERRYRYLKDAEIAFCQPYPEAETTRIYFRGSEVVCLSLEDKNCEAIRSDSAKREKILTGASDLLRQVSAAKPDSEVPDVDFLKYF